MKLSVFAFICIFVLAILSRWVPHPPNFTPVLAVLLFFGFRMNKVYLLMTASILALLLSDALIGFYPGMLYNYICFAVVALCGFGFQKSKVNLKQNLNLFFAASSSSVLFFLGSNFFVWMTSGLYAKNSSWALELLCYGTSVFPKHIAFNTYFFVCTV